MGLDMKPLGKPKKGCAERFAQIFRILEGVDKPKPSFWDRLRGKTEPDKEKLLAEWFSIQIPVYETIKAPKVGRDKVADDWLRERYVESDKSVSEAEFFKEHEDFYVVGLAEEEDGVPVYVGVVGEETAFRGQFLTDCEALLGEDLMVEAWGSKLAEDALDYGNRLMAVADRAAIEHGLTYLKTQRKPPDDEFAEDSMEWQLHIVFSLAKWLIFYGKNGHGYEADF